MRVKYRLANCKGIPGKGKLNSLNGCAVVAWRHGKMLPDLMVMRTCPKCAEDSEC